MGGAQSSTPAGGEEGGSKDLEKRLRGNGDLDILDRAFSHLTASTSEESSSSNKHSTLPSLSLQGTFALSPISIDEATYPGLSKVISHIGPAIVEELFDTGNEELKWVHLLEGFQKCTQTSGDNSLKLLISVYSRATESALDSSVSKIIEKVPGSEETYFDRMGYLTGAQLQDFLWLSWLLMCHSRLPRKTNPPKLQAFLPRIDSLLTSAISVCDITKSKDAPSEQNGLEKELPILEISSWVLSTIPGLGDCLLQYIRSQFERIPTKETDLAEEKEGSTTGSENTVIEDLDRSKEKTEDTHKSTEETSLLLQQGMAWAIGLYLRDSHASEILYKASCGLTKSPESEYPNLIYRSSIHGRGMNRFWTSVQGYQGLSLFLISAQTTEEALVDNSQGHKFALGALVPNGFENKESFYGASGSCLFSLEPKFLPMCSTGRDKNFVYSHKNTPGAGYRAQPKAEGVGFGGTYGKERVWLNEEFDTLTVRHHAVDKTYRAGSLVPNQGYATIVATVAAVEVWGLGGKTADEEQAGFLKRENLFSEQRRKVDLKMMFGNWQNSPEKLMMEMVSDPNAPSREER